MAKHLRLSALALAAASAAAQVPETVTITARTLAAPSVSGFGSAPLARSPLQASVVSAAQLADAAATSIAGLTRFDPTLSDAYNAEGYWSFLTVRGFVIDNRYNYRRDGLPINAETALALANKERIEVLEGTSGIQAGTSAPGGLVNLVVKRPTDSLRRATLSWQQDATVTAAVDLAERFGNARQFGLRVNAEAASLEPRVRAARGDARLIAVAAEWLPGPMSKLEAEFEVSRRSQPSVPGFSLLGSNVPSAHGVDPRTNLNNQPWSLPVVLDGDTASLRWQQRLADDWRAVAHGATQRLRNDDRVAFPFGCSLPSGDYLADRYCPDGSFDLYDFRSVGERRRVDAFELRVEGRLRSGRVEHDLTAGVLRTRSRDRFGRQAFNYAGTGRIDATAITAPAPELTEENTDRDESSTEWFLRDALRLGQAGELWAGLRHTRLDRRSVRTDGSRATAYSQSFTTPWLALSAAFGEQSIAYVSWGQGIESEVVPNRSRYANRGQALPALRSRQVEAGIKFTGDDLQWSLAAFDIRRPQAQDLCDEAAEPLCVRSIDGKERHRGVEAGVGRRFGSWAVQAGAMKLDAKRTGASDPALDGLAPTNVPEASARLQIAHDLAAVPGLTLIGHLVYEGRRSAVPEGSAKIGGWSRIDLAARWRVRLGVTDAVFRAGVDNATERRAWRESPYQFSHSYLFPLAPRTWRASAEVGF